MISKGQLIKTVSNFTGKSILVIGDIILDEYIWGKASRLSPEAPVPVLDVSKYSYILGGSANVASNISALGGNPVLVGVVGKDLQAEITVNELKKARVNADFIINDETRPTTLKTRLIAHNHQQLARADREVKTSVSSDIESKILKNISAVIKDVDLVILSDYAKGVLSTSLTPAVINLVKSHGKPILVDPKGLDFSKYSGVDLITPNRLEAEVATKSPVGTSAEELAIKLYDTLNVKHVLVTLGEDGLLLYTNGDFIRLPAVTSEVYDVTGAGDSLISALAIALVASEFNLEESIALGNYAAGVAVRRTGTAVVSPAELRDIIEHYYMSKETVINF